MCFLDGRSDCIQPRQRSSFVSSCTLISIKKPACLCVDLSFCLWTLFEVDTVQTVYTGQLCLITRQLYSPVYSTCVHTAAPDKVQQPVSHKNNTDSLSDLMINYLNTLSGFKNV